MAEPARCRGAAWASAARPGPFLPLHSLRGHVAADWAADVWTAGFQLEGSKQNPVGPRHGLSRDRRGAAGHRDPNLHGGLAAGMRVHAVADAQEDSYGCAGRIGPVFHFGNGVDPAPAADGMARPYGCGKRIPLADVERRSPAYCAASHLWRGTGQRAYVWRAVEPGSL